MGIRSLSYTKCGLDLGDVAVGTRRHGQLEGSEYPAIHERRSIVRRILHPCASDTHLLAYLDRRRTTNGRADAFRAVDRPQCQRQVVPRPRDILGTADLFHPRSRHLQGPKVFARITGGYPA